MLKYTVILEPENTGGYSVHCPSMPGCIAQGENKESAIENIKLAILSSAKAWKEDDLDAPEDSIDKIADEIFEILISRQSEKLSLALETAEVLVESDEFSQAPVPENEMGPLTLIVQEDPAKGAIKPGALRGLIRHSGMTTKEFLDYVQYESNIVQLITSKNVDLET